MGKGEELKWKLIECSKNLNISIQVLNTFLGYKDDNSVRPLGIILPQMSGYNKYFDNG